MKIDSEGYIERLTSSSRNGKSWGCCLELKRLILPQSYAGKKIRLKVEIVEE